MHKSLTVPYKKEQSKPNLIFLMQVVTQTEQSKKDIKDRIVAKSAKNFSLAEIPQANENKLLGKTSHKITLNTNNTWINLKI